MSWTGWGAEHEARREWNRTEMCSAQKMTGKHRFGFLHAPTLVSLQPRPALAMPCDDRIRNRRDTFANSVAEDPESNGLETLGGTTSLSVDNLCASLRFAT